MCVRACVRAIADHFYIALVSAREPTHCACMGFYRSGQLFIARFEYHRSGVLNGADIAGATKKKKKKKMPQSRRVLYTPYSHAPCHFLENHMRRVRACLDVACHLYFWQNDRDLLDVTANKSQHSKLTLEKKLLSLYN